MLACQALNYALCHTVSAEPEAESGWVAMRVAVCAAADARAACKQALRALVPPRMSPSKDLLEAPIWTTWARYFSRVSQAKVLKYAHEIVSRGLQASTSLPAHLHTSRDCLLYRRHSPDASRLTSKIAQELHGKQEVSKGKQVLLPMYINS